MNESLFINIIILLNWWLNIDKSLLISFFVLSFFGLVISFTIKPGSSLVDEVSILNFSY